jgi:hypothetical protein
MQILANFKFVNAKYKKPMTNGKYDKWQMINDKW